MTLVQNDLRLKELLYKKYKRLRYQMPYVRNQNRFSFRQKLRTQNSKFSSLTEILHKEQEQAAEIEAVRLNIPYINLTFIPINPEALILISREECQESQMTVFDKIDFKLKVGLHDIRNPKAKLLISRLTAEGYTIQLYYISEISLEKSVRMYSNVKQKVDFSTSELQISDNDIQSMKASSQNLADFSEQAKGAATSELLQLIITGAIVTQASDIHFEPLSNASRIRYRIDGVLQDIVHIESKSYNLIVPRLKSLANLVLNQKNTAQDGRFIISITQQDGSSLIHIDVRVSILPGGNGEIIVLRLLNAQVQSLDIRSFNIRPHFLDIIIAALEKPQGMIMISGPTGSGKTTSLYSFLNYLNKTDINIVTIEDPIEYRLRNINQTQVNKAKGYDFANGLKSIVRQDPDIIMVGEIRDNETANIAINAALTGHLVFSTLHTNNSIGVIFRLTDLGIIPELIVPAINLYIAQRLVRTLCSCKESYVPSDREVELITKALALISPRAGVEPPKNIKRLYRAVGCPKCFGLGYRGRVALYELFENREDLKEMILAHESESKLFQKALENGMVSLYQDGILHAVDGITSLDEVIRTVGDISYIDELYEKTLTSALSRGITIKKVNQKAKNSVLDLTSNLQTESLDRILPTIISYAIAQNATDIHFEPEQASLIIRLRIDGLLQKVATIPKSLYPQLLSQIKITSGLALEVYNAVQEGRFSIFSDQKTLDTRVSIIPGGYGQTIVIRILNPKLATSSLEDLGMDPQTALLLNKEITKTTGLILVTGPTSSGKTTTLYSILNLINNPALKIISIEDPIEYKLEGILQTTVDLEQNYTFTTALRALLRQNPNVMMIGEIRDSEAAHISFQAAATGHLLFSTLHTNDATGALLRLYDLGIGLVQIASFVNAVLAQRIIRKLCPNCRKVKILTKAEQSMLKQYLPQYAQPLVTSQIYEKGVCGNCTDGYSGTTAIFELFTMSAEIKKTIPLIKNLEDIRQQAIKQGMTTLTGSGVLKVVQGITDVQELERVLGLPIFANK